MRKKLTRPQIEEIVRAKLKDKLNEESGPDGTHIPGTSYNRAEIESGTQLPFQQRLAAKDAAPAAAPPGPPPAALSALGYSPKAGYPNPDIPPGDQYGSAYAGSGVVPGSAGGSPGLPMVPPVKAAPPPPMPAPGFKGEEGQSMVPPPANRDLDAESARRYGRAPGNRDVPVMPPLREEENMYEGVGMYLMNKAGAVSDSDYKNYNKYQNMKKQDKKNLGTSADNIKQGTGRARQFSQIDSGGTTESQLREFVRSKLTQILKTPNQKKVSESIFAPNHYCVHHGGVYLDGKMHMGEAINHNYDKKLGKVTHYKMRLDDGRILENVPAEVIQVTNASLAEYGGMSHGHRDDESDKDYDGDGKVETGSEEYMGSKDKAIKKAVKSEGSGDRNDKDREQGHGKQRQKAGSDGSAGDLEEGSGDRNDKDREQGHGKQRQKAGSDGSKGDLEEVSNKEWYDSQLFEALSRKWTK
jgi:hypothetical protein